jgi:transcriptional regulator with XRE-family HTH domain
LRAACIVKLGSQMVRDITPEARRSVLELWMGGLNYREISDRIGVSGGAISNIITDARRAAPDIDDLRKLNLVLKRLGMSPEDALRGTTFLEKLDHLQISTDTLDSSVSFYTRYGAETPQILAGGQRLRKLEETQGKPYEKIVAEADEATGRLNSMKEQIRQFEPRLNHLKNQEQTLRARGYTQEVMSKLVSSDSESGRETLRRVLTIEGYESQDPSSREDPRGPRSRGLNS